MSVPGPDETAPLHGATDLLYTDPGSGALTQRRIELVATQGPGAGPRAVLERGALVVGSHPDAQLVLQDPAVSRFHARLVLAEGGVRVVDLSSKNGTFHGSARVTEIVVAVPGEVRVGRTTLRLQSADRPMAGAEAEGFGGLLGRTLAMRQLFAVLGRAAPTDSTILLEGESGTGKEVCARAIHGGSPRVKGPFVVLDCAALPPSLAESELFGHVKGAFTDASTDRAGAFERAHGGTLFLDELGELPRELQPKLLRAIQQREIQRVGDGTTRAVDVRLVAATNRELLTEVKQGRFREDLYWRLAVVCVRMPALRDRAEDVPLLAAAFARALGGELPAGALAAYAGWRWPGNVRELRNVVERVLTIGAELPPAATSSGGAAPRPAATLFGELPYKEARERAIESFERDYVAGLLERHGGNVRRAAEAAGIDRVYLHKLARRHGLKGQGGEGP